MLVVGDRLPVLVAVDAGDDLIIRLGLMTFRTAERAMRTRADVELVSECCPQPGVRVVARFAILRKPCNDVIWVGRSLVVGQMALDTA